MLRRFDWHTSIKDAARREVFPWAIAIVVMPATQLLLRVFLPDVPWLMRYWITVMLVGCLFSLGRGIWQLRDPGKRGRPSGKSFFVETGGAIFASLFLIDAIAQERMLQRCRSTTPSELRQIILDQRTLNDPVDIASFVKLIQKAQFFGARREASVRNLHVMFTYANGDTEEFSGRVPGGHRSDIVIEFRAFITLDDLIIPNGATWVNP